MAEEHRCQAPPEGPRLCANNCGFVGSPAMLGLCSKCYRDYRLKEEQEASAKMAVEKTLLASASASAPSTEAAAEHTPSASASAKMAVEKTLHASAPSTEAAAEQTPSASASAAIPRLLVKKEPCSTALAARSAPAPAAAPQRGRCTACRKRVRLMGFRCRCGETFCGTHRYPEQHGCTFDFKSAGREAIARANPVVKADKLNKI